MTDIEQWANDEAARMLPCVRPETAPCDPKYIGDFQCSNCRQRPVVAKLLAELKGEVEVAKEKIKWMEIKDLWLDGLDKDNKENVARLASLEAERDELRAEVERLRNIPVDALLDCPKCGEPHIDQPQPE